MLVIIYFNYTSRMYSLHLQFANFTSASRTYSRDTGTKDKARSPTHAHVTARL